MSTCSEAYSAPEPLPSRRPSRSPAPRLLVVEDDPDMRALLVEGLQAGGYDVASAQDAFKALGKLEDCHPDLVLTDLRLPGMDGLDLIAKLLERHPDLPILVLTSAQDIETAVTAMRRGAAHFMRKPISLEGLCQIVERELARRGPRRTALHAEPSASPFGLPGLIGDSASIRVLCDAVRQIAPSRASVLITGESGTGKELVAAAIHAQSPRARGPFVKLHCAALAETLLESELFGHERGAFTGALGRRDGRFHQADGGTLLLDEVGDIPVSIQVKLLRVLQEHEFERVGGNQTLKVDVRVIAATHRELREQMRQGLFREDLYYRLNVVVLEVPPLRSRRSDIPLLATHFLRRFALENHRNVVGFTADAMERLVGHTWPGNVRELENTVERAVVLVSTDHIRGCDLALPATGEWVPCDRMPPIPGASIAELERYLILRTLEHTGGSRVEAARILGITARTIQTKLHQYEHGVGPATAEHCTGTGCTLTQGYWKTHEENWPVGSLTLGNTTYTQAQLLVILNTPPQGDASLILAHQLIAALLNQASGASSSAQVSAAIADAQAWMAANADANGLPYGVAAKTAAGAQAVALSKTLTSYNEGNAGTIHCDPFSTR